MFVVLPNDETDIRQVQSKFEQFDVAQINDQLAKVRQKDPRGQFHQHFCARFSLEKQNVTRKKTLG